MISLWWIRRDLRLADNPALQSALQRGPVMPVFVLDPFLLAVTPVRRQNFLFNGLRVLEAELKLRGSGLILRRGAPESALTEPSVNFGSLPNIAEAGKPTVKTGSPTRKALGPAKER